MGMKPRLNDGPAALPTVVNNPKKVSEDAPMPSNLVTQRKGTGAPLHAPNLATCSKGN